MHASSGSKVATEKLEIPGGQACTGQLETMFVNLFLGQGESRSNIGMMQWSKPRYAVGPEAT